MQDEIKEIEAIKAKQKSPEKGKPDNRQALEQALLHPQQVVASDVTKKLQATLVDEDDSEMAFHDILTGDILDNDFMDNIMSEGDDIKVEEGLVDFRTATDDSNDFSLDQTSQDMVNPKDEFNDILTTQFGIDNIDPGLPSMDSKDVEDIFKGVLIEGSQETLFSQVNCVPAVAEGIRNQIILFFVLCFLFILSSRLSAWAVYMLYFQLPRRLVLTQIK